MKREFILYISMSLDGYIAKKDGSIDWLADHVEGEVDLGYETFLSTVDTVIMGSKTYKQIVEELSPDVWPYEDKKCYVVTSSDYPQNPHVTFVSDIDSLVCQLQQEEGKDIWILGGSKVVAHFMEKNLIDEFQIAIMPVILQEGIPLFSYEGKACSLRLVESKVISGVTLQTYRKK